jgi:Ser/Thr protein kinase RdoA (MazF antagonist)
MTATLDSPAPYVSLTPDAVLDAFDAVGLRGDGRMISLNSYENRVYQVWIEGGPSMVAKFYRPERWTDEQIAEEHAFVFALAAREIPVVAPVITAGRSLHRVADFRFAVYPRQSGRAPELADPDALQWIGRFLARIHSVGELETFTTRPALDIDTYGHEPREFLLASDFLPPDLFDAYQSVSAQALDGVLRCFDRAGDVATLRLHGDCHAGNILWAEAGMGGATQSGPHFVDFDDARSGPAIQDLWMLLSGERSEQELQLREVLAGYEQFRSFDRRELHLVEALRTLRLVHYAAWIARRWHDPAFPAAFPWFNTQRYWQDRILELREQVALMDEEPLDVR